MKRENFPAFVTKERLKRKLSKYAMAKLLGINWVTIWRWEEGRSAPKDDAIEYWVERIKGA